MPLFSQENEGVNFDKKYHQDSIKTWTKNILDIMQKGHPGFYRYTSKEEFDVIIDARLQTVTDSLTTLDFYRNIKPLIAQIGCLHTGIALPEAYETAMRETKTHIPLEIFIDENRKVFITKDHAKNVTIPIKGELLSINDTPIDSIIETLLKAIPSDGYNETEKVLALNLRFPFWYQSIIEMTDAFKVKIRSENIIQEYTIQGITPEVFPTQDMIAPTNKEQLVFEVRDNIGVLKIQTFAKTTIKSNGQHFKKFIKDVFKTLEEEEVENLIIDLRYNTGGTDGNAALLASYFFDEEFRYWDRIEVTEQIAGQVSKGMAKIFYSKPEKKDSTYLWKGALLTKEFRYYKPQKPAKYNFKGQTYLLTNGFCMSSAADFIAILSDNKKAKVVGEESAGGYQGNTSGLMPEVIMQGGFVITVPLHKYVNAVDPNKNIGRGTIPDYPVSISLEDWISKKDVVKSFAFDLINK
ncbi:S41 family peptidase [Dokdonia sp.]|uniref:S41 family peptidase n=1 Tax=Dokdonia sp. TaxID=2024995 RepID=UPI0032679EDC